MDVRPGDALSDPERADLLISLAVVLPSLSHCHDVRIVLEPRLTPVEFAALARRALVPLGGRLRTLHLAFEADAALAPACGALRDAHLLGGGALRALTLDLEARAWWSASPCAATDCVRAWLVPPPPAAGGGAGGAHPRLAALDLRVAGGRREGDNLAAAVCAGVEAWGASLETLGLTLEEGALGGGGAARLADLPARLAAAAGGRGGAPLRAWTLRAVTATATVEEYAPAAERAARRGWGALLRAALGAPAGPLPGLRRLAVHLDPNHAGVAARDQWAAAGAATTGPAPTAATTGLRELAVRWPDLPMVGPDPDDDGEADVPPAPPGDLGALLVRRLAAVHPGLERLALANVPYRFGGPAAAAADAPVPGSPDDDASLPACRALDLVVAEDEGWPAALRGAAATVERVRLRFTAAGLPADDVRRAWLLRRGLETAVGDWAAPTHPLAACRALRLDDAPGGGDWLRDAVDPRVWPVLARLDAAVPTLWWDPTDRTWAADACAGAAALADVTLVVRTRQAGGDRTRALAAALRPLTAALAAPGLRSLAWSLEGGVGPRADVAGAVAAAAADPGWGAATRLARLTLGLARAPVGAADLAGLLTLGVRRLPALRDLEVRVGPGTRCRDAADARLLEAALPHAVAALDGRARAVVTLEPRRDARVRVVDRPDHPDSAAATRPRPALLPPASIEGPGLGRQRGGRDRPATASPWTLVADSDEDDGGRH